MSWLIMNLVIPGCDWLAYTQVKSPGKKAPEAADEPKDLTSAVKIKPKSGKNAKRGK
jgi:hypothetical protein